MSELEQLKQKLEELKKQLLKVQEAFSYSRFHDDIDFYQNEINEIMHEIKEVEYKIQLLEDKTKKYIILKEGKEYLVTENAGEAWNVYTSLTREFGDKFKLIPPSEKI